MAETNKKADSAKKKVEVRLPRAKGQNAIQEEFFSVNGRNYIIKRGETAEIPVEVAEVIRNAEREEEVAMRYVESLSELEAEKKKELGL